MPVQDLLEHSSGAWAFVDQVADEIKMILCCELKHFNQSQQLFQTAMKSPITNVLIVPWWLGVGFNAHNHMLDAHGFASVVWTIGAGSCCNFEA